MKRLVRLLGMGFGGIAGVGALALGTIYVLSGSRMSKSYDVEPHTVTVPRDSASVAYGEHVFTIRGCADCHGEDLGGYVFIDEAPLARLAGTNLTSGEGGVADRYDSAEDWEMAIRHGLRPGGEPVLFMPSSEYHPLSDRDLGALIAYLESAPAVDRVQPEPSIRPLGRLLFVLGEIPLVHADLIDHDVAHPDAPPAGPTAAYGRYVATSCTGCHGPELAGGPIPGTPPSWPSASNLTPHPEDGLGAWDEEDFFAALRRGRRPDGTALDTVMPWRNTARMTDTEIRAVWSYVQTLPARPGGG